LDEENAGTHVDEGDEYKSKVAEAVGHSTRLSISRIHHLQEAKAVN
jgi:hypothetical protein